MKKFSLITTACLLGMVAQAQLIDDYSGNLAAYTATRILNNGNHSPANTYAWQIDNGALRINTTAYVGIEQFALTRLDAPLAVGYELTASYTHLNLGSQDLGLYVGAGTPTADVRADYVNVYVRNNGQIFTRGFNGASELSLAGGGTPANISSLFVARPTLNTYELGYYDGATRNLLTTRTMSNSAIGSAIGFYADVRAAGIRGVVDNLTLTAIPEPTTAALFGVGSLGLLFRLRRK